MIERHGINIALVLALMLAFAQQPAEAKDRPVLRAVTKVALFPVRVAAAAGALLSAASIGAGVIGMAASAGTLIVTSEEHLFPNAPEKFYLPTDGEEAGKE